MADVEYRYRTTGECPDCGEPLVGRRGVRPLAVTLHCPACNWCEVMDDQDNEAIERLSFYDYRKGRRDVDEERDRPPPKRRTTSKPKKPKKPSVTAAPPPTLPPPPQKEDFADESLCAIPLPSAVLTLTSADDFVTLPDGRSLIYAADGYLADKRCYHNRPKGMWCQACYGDNTTDQEV